ncbi:MAG TPA: type II toxin-antitoxin system VapC family toxin [Gemmataceae bacterium]|nr:type II toxin-antitoxin system VapC family toxin [Gemmataceae bacterium]
MRLLLDTHALLWFLNDDPKLSATAKSAIEDPANERFLSPACLVEIALKVRLGKLPLKVPFSALFPAALTTNDIHLLPLEAGHIEPLTTLPLHHRDPFDRLVAATALVEGLTVVSVDGAFDAYGIARLW